MLKNSQENICVEVSFFNKVEDLKKETPALVFFCDLCEIFKNTFSQNCLCTFKKITYFGTAEQPLNNVTLTTSNFLIIETKKKQDKELSTEF